ncbi:MAG: endonuclease/exonuclease/phosphatase family protein [Pseudomonadota bacterium]
MVRVLCLTFSGIALLGAVMTLFASFGLPFELFSHFRPLFAVLAAAIAVLIALKDWRLSLPALAAALLFAGQTIWGTDWRAENPSIEGNSLTVAWANIFRSRDAAEAFAALIEEHQPDVVGIAEADMIRNDRIAELFSGYLHSAVAEVDFRKKVILLSRFPVSDVVIHDDADPLRPWISATITTPDGPWLVAAAHAMAPFSAGMLRDRDRLIEDVEKWMVNSGDMVMGDFNATPWSPALKRSGLERAGNPFPNPTWGRKIPLLGLPIDHVFVSDRIGVREVEVWPAIGSDHFPLYAEIVRAKK